LVVHLAALLLAHGDNDLLARVNRDGTAHLLACARTAGIRRVVHVSSISVQYRRQNAYSRSKREGEDLVRASGLDWTILRPTLAWGDPAAIEHETFHQRVLRPAILPLPGGGRAHKAPVHVDDLAAAFEAAERLVVSRMSDTAALSGDVGDLYRDLKTYLLASREGWAEGRKQEGEDGLAGALVRTWATLLALPEPMPARERELLPRLAAMVADRIDDGAEDWLGSADLALLGGARLQLRSAKNQSVSSDIPSACIVPLGFIPGTILLTSIDLLSCSFGITDSGIISAGAFFFFFVIMFYLGFYYRYFLFSFFVSGSHGFLIPSEV
jgi:uncharacterized protein YbjT (DUF2867 family)